MLASGNVEYVFNLAVYIAVVCGLYWLVWKNMPKNGGGDFDTRDPGEF